MSKRRNVKVDGYRIRPAKFALKTNDYKEEWEDEPECEGWLTRGNIGAKCAPCNTEITARLNEVKKHGRSSKHLKSMASMWDKQGLGKQVRDDIKLGFHPWQLPDIKKRDFELKVALFLGLEARFRGSDELCGLLFDKLAPDAFGATTELSLNTFRTVLVPHFKDLIKKDMADAPYSLVFDDASHMVIPGQVSVCIYYHSPKSLRTISTYLGLVRIDQDDLNVTVESLVELLAEWELYGYNMVSIITDGISSVCPKCEDLVTLLTPTCPNLMHVHSSFFSISYAFHSAFKKSLPANLEFMLLECHNWFAQLSMRQLSHQKLLENSDMHVRYERLESGLENDMDDGQFCSLVPIAPDSSQWLRIADYTTGLFLNYDAFKDVFNTAANDEGGYMAQMLGQEFASDLNRLYFTGLQPVLTQMCHLQQEEDDSVVEEGENSDRLPTKMSDKLDEFFLSVAAKVFDKEFLKTVDSAEALCELKILSSEGPKSELLNPEDVDFGPNFETVLQGSILSEEEKFKARTDLQCFFKDFYFNLQAALKDVFAIMSNADYFSSQNFLSDPLVKSRLISPFFGQTDNELKEVVSKYGLMKMLEWKNKDNTYKFWKEVHGFGDATGNYPLRVLSNGVWKMNCVPIFNHRITRTFAGLNRIRREHRSMDLDIQEEILICKTGLRGIGYETRKFQPPPSMIKQ